MSEHRTDPIPVVLGSMANAYGLVRAAGEAGLRSIVADGRCGPAMASRYVRNRWKLRSSRPSADSVDELLDRAGTLRGSHLLLIPTSEPWVVQLMEHRDRLDGPFELALASSPIARTALDKLRMHDWCLQHAIPVPEAVLYTPGDDWGAILDRVAALLPAIAKPQTKGVGDQDLGFMTRIFETEQELRAWASKWRDSGPACPLQIQKVVRGAVTNIVAYHGFRDRDGRTSMAGIRKHRIMPPPCGGSTSVGSIVEVPEVSHMVLKVLHELGYFGFFDMEFLQDEVTGIWYFIELNPRPGMPNYVATVAGRNLLAAAAGRARKTVRPSPDSGQVLWGLFLVDFINYVLLYPRSGYGLGFSEWLRSVRGRRVHAFYNPEDPVVAVAHVLTQAAVMLKHSLQCRRRD